MDDIRLMAIYLPRWSVAAGTGSYTSFQYRLYPVSTASGARYSSDKALAHPVEHDFSRAVQA